MTSLDLDAPQESDEGVAHPVANPKRPLHDRAAEAHVLSCLLLDPQPDLPPEVFYFPEHRLLYLSIQRLRAAGSPVELATIAADLADRQQFTQVGEWPFLFGIENRTEIPTTVHFAHYRQRVAELANLRVAKAHAEATLAALAHGQTPPPAPRPITAGHSSPKSTRVRFTKPPKEPETRLFLAGKPICTPGNLTTIISRAKTGKTATLGAAVAAIIASHHDKHDLDTLGFTAPHTKEAVILIDTEQSPYDAWTCHSRVLSRADSPDPDWLHHHAMVGFTPRQLRDGLTQVIHEATALHQGIFTIILDGVADFVSSVNDEAETKEFIAWLRTITVAHNTPVICVIHSNEGVKTGDDGRGHLGKELTRKAESNLLLKKVGEVTTITSEKQRKAPITEADNIAFQWSDEHQRHISCGNPSSAKSSKSGPKPKYDAEAMLNCVPTAPSRPMSVNQIHRLVGELPCSINIRTFKDYMAKWVETGEVTRITDAALGFTFRRPS